MTNWSCKSWTSISISASERRGRSRRNRCLTVASRIVLSRIGSSRLFDQSSYTVGSPSIIGARLSVLCAEQDNLLGEDDAVFGCVYTSGSNTCQCKTLENLRILHCSCACVLSLFPSLSILPSGQSVLALPCKRMVISLILLGLGSWRVIRPLSWEGGASKLIGRLLPRASSPTADRPRRKTTGSKSVNWSEAGAMIVGIDLQLGMEDPALLFNTGWMLHHLSLQKAR